MREFLISYLIVAGAMLCEPVHIQYGDIWNPYVHIRPLGITTGLYADSSNACAFVFRYKQHREPIFCVRVYKFD